MVLIKVRRVERPQRNRALRLALHTVALLSLARVGLLPVPALAHGMSAGDKPLVSGMLSLKHLRVGDVISLFAREQLPTGAAKLPRAARAGTDESLLPVGVDALLPAAEAGTVALVGNEDLFPRLNDCLRVLDVPVETTTSGRQRIVLTLHQADARSVRASVLRLPGRGSAIVNGHQLVLEGTPEWLHRSLRQVIRGELGNPITPEPPRA